MPPLKSVRLTLSVLCSLSALLFFTGQIHAQVPTSGGACNGTYTGTFNGNVTVSASQTCHFTSGGIVGNVTLNGGTFHLSNAAVRGNVQGSGGTLILTNATVVGNVEIKNGGAFSIGPSVSINGNLQIHNLPAGPRLNQICGSTVSGNLQFQNDGTAVQIGAASRCAGNTIGGNLQVQNNAASTTLFNNTIRGETQDQNNTGPTLVIGNTVGGNLQVQNDSAPATLAFNNVQKNLLCQNSPLIAGGSNISKQDQGCPTTLQASAFATSNGGSIVFKSPAGTTVLTIPLVNQSVVNSTPQGNVTNTTNQSANISDDGSHAGVYTYTYSVTPSDIDQEPLETGTFAYYDASGQLWQITAPLGTPFYFPLDPSQRLITPDGSRVLTISADDGNTSPAFSVYDQNGNTLYQPAQTFSELYQAQLSPNGRYLLVMGIVYNKNTSQDLVTVTDITNNVSSSLPFNVVTGGMPIIGISSDGRFLISYQGSQTVLPIE